MLGNLDVFAQQITYALVNRKVAERQSELSLTMNDYGKNLDFVKLAVEGERAAEAAKGEEK